VTVLHQTDEWVFAPAAPYEITGDVSRVIFPTGWVADAASDDLHLYYGAADSVIGVATASMRDVMRRVCDSPAPARHRATDLADSR
jgi:predicted GH43/DUF377 family glycosyl hydrolase